MTPVLIFAVLVLAIAQLTLPRKWAFLPLVVAGAHLGNIEVLPELTPGRLLILLGLGNALRFGYLNSLGSSRLDRWFLFFSCVAILSTLGHKADPWVPSPLNARLGLVLNVLGTYLYGRAYLPDIDSFQRYASVLPLILLPLAICMAIEHRTRQNLYFSLGAANEEAAMREEKVRAQGPFRHPILAGSAGATILPLVYLLWQMKLRRRAMIGIVACLGIVLSCASSGPLAAVAISLASVFFWHKRSWLKPSLWGLVGVALLFSLVSGKGPWYLMAKIDLVGGSTGWHRAYLIDQGFRYLGEWWLMGTDYTRHWMGSGVTWNPNVVDITNYYLHLGVIGGLPLTICLFAFIVQGIRMIRQSILTLGSANRSYEIALWCAGASLATHAVSFVSISYFDQMYIFFYLLLGAIPGLVAGTAQPLAPSRPSPVAEPPSAKPLRYYS